MPRILIKELDSTEKGKGSDMSLYFNHTFVRVSPDGEAKPKWAKYEGHDSVPNHVFTLGDGSKCIIPFSAANAYVEWMYPTGWFNTKNSSVFCRRIPKRQYFKGITNQGNFSFVSAETLAKQLGMLATAEESDIAEMITSVELRSMADHKLTIANVEAIFEAAYPTFAEAYVSLKACKSFSRALSPEISLLPHPHNKDFIVMCNDIPVAELVTTKKVKMVVPEFKPECLAYFSKEGISVVS